jgi:pimeloyl-ACP methyl ester carboxylesterase
MHPMTATVLAHRIEGEPGGLPVVLVHPLGADQTFWDESRRHLGERVMTVSCDLRGSGQSPDLVEPLRLDRTAGDIEALRRHLGLERIVVVGCAVGAMAAARYAARYADRVLALVMANPGFRITEAGRAHLAERVPLVRADGMQAILPEAVAGAFTGWEDTERRWRYQDRFAAQTPENYALAALGAGESDISGDLPLLRCPVLVVSGRNDLRFGPPHVAEIAPLLPDATYVELEDGAHFIPYQQPAEFGAAVRKFLDRVRKRGRPPRE